MLGNEGWSEWTPYDYAAFEDEMENRRRIKEEEADCLAEDNDYEDDYE